MKKCPNCNKIYNTGEHYCLKCRYRLVEDSSDEKPPTKPTNTPTCPTCGSTKLKKISTAKRAAHMWAFGLFSKTSYSQFECENCGYKW